MKKKLILLLITSILLLSFLNIFFTSNVKAFEDTIYVSHDGSRDYIKIQDAIDYAETGNKVYVFNGLYEENLIINKTITLAGEGKSNTTIDGNGNNVVSIFSDNVEIQGFTIKNGNNGIILNNSSHNIIKENNILNTNCGIYIDELSGNNLIYLNNIINNIKNAYDLSTNFWNYSSDGNYWDDYNGTDDNDDGIGDSPYFILGDGISKDQYPKMKPISNVPYADFMYYPINPTTQDTIQFNDSSIDLDGEIVTWFWNFGDGNVSTLQNTTHKYNDDGIFYVILEVSDNYGLSSNLSKKITILNEKPEVNFTYFPTAPNDIENVTFADKSFDLDGYIVSWSWNFGEGNISVLKNPSFRFVDNGIYTITLEVIDDDGASNKLSTQIQIFNVKPIANFNFYSFNNSILVNEKVQFWDTSEDLDGEIVSWKWTFDDETIISEENPTRIYSNKGTYKVALTVTDDDGEVGIKTQYITVSTGTEGNRPLQKGFSTFDIIFVVFIFIMVGMVIFLSKKFG